MNGVPARIEDLEAVSVFPPRLPPGKYKLIFTTPDGDLGLDGMQAAVGYDIRYSRNPINTWEDFLFAHKVPNVFQPLVGGTTQVLPLSHLPKGPIYFSVVAIGTNGMGSLSDSPWASIDGSSPPIDSRSKAFDDHMVFQMGDPDSDGIQLVLQGRKDSWEPTHPNHKDDSTGIFLKAFGERFLTGTDDSSGSLFQNSESQNVILVDDPIAGPQDELMVSGPGRATLASLQSHVVSPILDYGLMTTELGSPNDSGHYSDKVRLNRHVIFPDHKFFVVVDEIEAVDGESHEFGWTAHCHGMLTHDGAQHASFTKSSNRKLDVHFFGPGVSIEDYTLSHKVRWDGSPVDVPYVVAQKSGEGTQYVTAICPRDLDDADAGYEPLATDRGTAGKIIFGETEYWIFAQETPRERVRLGNRLRTNGTVVLVKTTSGDLDYVFVLNQSRWLKWDGAELFRPNGTRSFIYQVEDPATGGPSILTVAD